MHAHLVRSFKADAESSPQHDAVVAINHVNPYTGNERENLSKPNYLILTQLE